MPGLCILPLKKKNLKLLPSYLLFGIFLFYAIENEIILNDRMVQC